jgi:hypothetical protein
MNENEETPRNEAGEKQPKELETKTENGKEYIFLNGKWEEKRLPKPKKETKEGNIPIKIKIGDAVEITGKARIETFKNDRKGYCYKIDENQPVYGGGNIFIRV